MNRWDILLDSEKDLLIESGDFVTGPSDNQHVALIVEAVKGEIRSSPDLGFGIARYLKKNTSTKREFFRNLKLEIDKDGYDDVEVEFNAAGRIIIN